MRLSKSKFKKLLLVAVDEGLSSLGKSSKQAIYSHLSRKFNISKQEIPERIEAFTGAIEDIFGVGANFLELIIMQQIHDKVGHQAEWQESKDLTFPEYVSAAKKSFLEREETQKIGEDSVQWEQMRIEN